MYRDRIESGQAGLAQLVERVHMYIEAYASTQRSRVGVRPVIVGRIFVFFMQIFTVLHALLLLCVDELLCDFNNDLLYFKYFK